MALSATFAADFSSFTDAVAKAEVSLKSFESGAGKVEISLNKMSNSLSGTKMIQDATLMVEAVDRVGGVSKLTEKELAKVSAQATEAAAKLVAMGQDVPPGLQKIADASKEVTVSHQSWGEQIKANALGYVAGMISFNAFVSAGRAVIDFLKDSLVAAGESETAQKRLTVAMENQGTALPGLIKGHDELAKQFQRTTVYSDEAIKELEVMLIQVGNVMPAKMQLAVAATTDLASGMGIELPAAALLMSKASEGNVTALHKMGIELDASRVKGEGLEYIAGQIEKRFGGQALAELDTYAGKVKKVGDSWDEVKESTGRLILSTGILQTSMSVSTLQADLLSGALDLNATSMGIAFARWVEGVTGVKGLEDAVKRATSATVEHSAAMREAATSAKVFAEEEAELTKLADYNASATKRSSDGYYAFQARLDAIADRLSGKSLSDKVFELSLAIEMMGGASKITAFEMAGVVKQIDEFAKEGAALDPVLRAIQFSHLNLNASVDASYGALVKVIGSVGAYKNAWVEIPPVMTDAVFTSEALATATDRVAAATLWAARASLSWSEAMDLVNQGLGTMTGSIPNSTDFSEARRQEIQAAYDAHRYYGPVLAGGGVDFKALGFPDEVSWRAEGGPVSAGSPYIVGERGPELFTPSTSGWITPNGAGGVTNHISISVTQPLGSPAAIARAVGDALISIQRGQGTRFALGV